MVEGRVPKNIPMGSSPKETEENVLVHGQESPVCIHSVPSSSTAENIFSSFERPFRVLSKQEKDVFKRIIETGNKKLFLERVWCNPRYLIDSTGGPSVLQEETQHNAFHVAAQFRETEMLLTILSTILDARFISLLYPADASCLIKARIKQLVQMYVNMPDKMLSETPMHIACKYGSDSVLAILLSFPQCDINRKNKNGLVPKEMICDCHSGPSDDLKKKMLTMFEAFYVPVLKNERTNNKFVGEPCHSNIVLAATLSWTPSGANAVYCGFAGPMSLSAAQTFHTLLRKQSLPQELDQNAQLIAKNWNTHWIRRWPVFDYWYTQTEGLKFLNKHLQNQEFVRRIAGKHLSFASYITSFCDDVVETVPKLLINIICMKFSELFQSLVQYMHCMTEFSFSLEKEIFLVHREIGNLLHLRLIASNNFQTENFHALNFLNLNAQFNLHAIKSVKWQMFLCILKFACYFTSTNASHVKEPTCLCKWPLIQEEKYTFSSKICYFSILNITQDIHNLIAVAPDKNEKKRVISKKEASLPNKKFQSLSDKKNQFRFASCVSTKSTASSTVDDERLIPFKYLPLSFKMTKIGISNGCVVEDVSRAILDTEHVDTLNDLSECYGFEKKFAMTMDKFFSVFYTLMERYNEMNFTGKGSFFAVFKEVMPYFSTFCWVNFFSDKNVKFFHSEIATTLKAKMLTIPSHIIARYKLYFENEISTYSYLDLSKNYVTFVREWMYMLCVLKQFCYLLDGKDIANRNFCSCKFESEFLGVSALDCILILKELQYFYELNAKIYQNSQHPLNVSPEDSLKDIDNILTSYGSSSNTFAPSTAVDERLIPFIYLPLSFRITKRTIANGYAVENVRGATTSEEENAILSECFGFEKYFAISMDIFYSTFHTLMQRYTDKMPFSEKSTFFDVLKDIMPYFEEFCRINYFPNNNLRCFHLEIALTLTAKMITIPFYVVKEYKLFFETEVFISKCPDLSKYGVTSTQGWMHLLCVIKYWCYLLDDEGTASRCSCKFESDVDGISTFHYILILKELRYFYKENAKIYLKSMPPVCCRNSLKNEDEKATPCSSSSYTMHDIFMNGSEITDDDIEVFKFLSDDGLMISATEFPYLYKWKCLMESKQIAHQTLKTWKSR